jgi:hypothetical protein
VAVATLAYFSGVHGRLKLPEVMRRLTKAIGSRECLVGALFAAGCVLPAWSVDPVAAGPASPLRLLVLPAVCFSALAWLNVRAITRWEAGLRLRRMAWVLTAGGVLLAAGLATGLLMARPRMAALLAAGAVSALLIGWLDHMSAGWQCPPLRRRPTAGDPGAGQSARIDPVTLRAAVDLALLTPLLLVMVR